MIGWMHQVGALFGRRKAVATSAPSTPVVASGSEPRGRHVAASSRQKTNDASLAPRTHDPSSRPSATEALATEEDWRLRLFEWVVGRPARSDALHADESRILAHLDSVLASDDARTSLLPRAPAIIPQLLNSLRQEGTSARSLAEHVMRDPHLVAEVIRIANSALSRASEPVVDIAQAVDRIGMDGLRRAIARVLLKPMFGGTGDTLSARCAQRLWQHSQAEAAACQRDAAVHGLDPFEGYLTGMMHDIGWTAALRAIDRSAIEVPAQFSAVFVEGFARRREIFFARVVVSWRLTDGLTAVGMALLGDDPTLARSPLGEALLEAEHGAANEVLAAHRNARRTARRDDESTAPAHDPASVIAG